MLMTRKPTEKIVNLDAEGRVANRKDGVLLACKGPVDAPEERKNTAESFGLGLPFHPDQDLHGFCIGVQLPLAEDPGGFQGHRPLVAQDRMAELVSHQDIEERGSEQVLIEGDAPSLEDGSKPGILRLRGDQDRRPAIGLCRGIREGLGVSQGLVLSRDQRDTASREEEAESHPLKSREALHPRNEAFHHAAPMIRAANRKQARTLKASRRSSRSGDIARILLLSC